MWRERHRLLPDRVYEPGGSSCDPRAGSDKITASSSGSHQLTWCVRSSLKSQMLLQKATTSKTATEALHVEKIGFVAQFRIGMLSSSTLEGRVKQEEL